MATRKVLRLGHPVLRQKARELKPSEISSDQIQVLIDDMVQTMKDYGGIGLAAPQIGESIRLAIIEIPPDQKRYKVEENQSLLVLVNPKIKVLDRKTLGFWEGCLSVPGLRGFVERPKKIQVSFLDRNGQSQTMVLHDFLAVVFQHELDHLDGVLYIDKLSHPHKLAYNEEFDQFVGSDDEEF